MDAARAKRIQININFIKNDLYNLLKLMTYLILQNYIAIKLQMECKTSNLFEELIDIYLNA